MDALSGLKAGPSITEQVYRAIRALVLSGGHRPGSRLSEAGLAERLEVSRGPVREALERLAQEGLVVRVPRRGSFVRRYGASEVSELMELRRVLETAAARLAVRRAEDADLAAVERLLDAANRAIDNGHGYPPDKDFHQAIVRLAGNRALERATSLVYDQLRLARALAAQRPGRAREVWREHAAILHALLARNEDAADAAVQEHLAAATAAMQAWVEEADAA
ncbi:MAG: GntR family transcriptional regulator [Deinococcales bacterium]